jgi:DMSO reductase family type II enzyme chaperone
MQAEISLRRSQVYALLSTAFLYPQENWTEDLALLARLADELGVRAEAPQAACDLETLQAEHRRTFGLTGSLCYETEYGAANAFAQGQWMADLAGFYRAFGFQLGGQVRERPDHIAAELEFMHLLCLKACLAAQQGPAEHLEVCLQAQRRFLAEHLARWVPMFARVLAAQPGEESSGALFRQLAAFTAAFVTQDADRLGAKVEAMDPQTVRPTPFEQDFSCATCVLNGMERGEG